MIELDKIYNEDCLEGMKRIADGAVDCIITDLPYGTTACAWDSVIPFEPLWEQFKRVTKPNAAIVLFSSQPFTSVLISSNIADFSHQWIWNKGDGANPFLATKMPIKNFEEVVVFYKQYDDFDWRREYFAKIQKFIGKSKKQIIDETNQSLDHCFRTSSKQFAAPTEKAYNLLISQYGIDKMDGFKAYDEIRRMEKTYNPMMVVKGKPKKKGAKIVNRSDGFLGGAKQDNIKVNNVYYPQAIIKFNKDKGSRFHPTQKPVDLLRYLILTYSNEGDTILDATIGSGTTAVAALMEKRHFIGFETNREYFDIAQGRIDEVRRNPTLF